MTTKSTNKLDRFDQATLTKLEIFEQYVQAWLPTFVMSKSHDIYIFDFFAGSGYDKNRNPGTPIRVLRKVKEFISEIIDKNVSVKIVLNEFKKDKFQELKKACDQFMEENKELKGNTETIFHNTDFEECFAMYKSEIAKFPSLVLIDQFGIKFLNKNYLNTLCNTEKIDFLYFVSSSYFRRFGDKDEFKKHFDIELEEAKKRPYRFIHSHLIKRLKKETSTSGVMLYPFSIKKGSNIHGIVFGASHILAADKFLNIAWKQDKIGGQANFDINEDLKKNQLRLFEERQPTKIEHFNELLQEQILSGKIKTNEDAYYFAIKNGHIARHAADKIKEMKKKGLIEYDERSPLVTYVNVFKSERIINYRILKGKML